MLDQYTGYHHYDRKVIKKYKKKYKKIRKKYQAIPYTKYLFSSRYKAPTMKALYIIE